MNSTSFIADFWSRIRRTHPLSAHAGTGFLILAALALGGVFLDDRIVTGAPVWMKPFKFLISAAIYAWTFAWFLSFIRAESPRLVKWTRRLGTVTVVALIIEIAVILFQAARGITSHFNMDGALNSIFWSIMAWAIIALWVVNLAAMVLLIRQKALSRPFDWSLRLGIIIASVGMLAAFQMTNPTPAQMEKMQQGDMPKTMGAHTVGAPDGSGRSLPGIHWNRDHGDLRVPHFFSLHAMQALPLFGWWILRRRRYDDNTATKMVWNGGAWYFAIFLIMTLQALLGQAPLSPSPTIMLAYGGVTLAALLAGGVIHLKNQSATGESGALAGESVS